MTPRSGALVLIACLVPTVAAAQSTTAGDAARLQAIGRLRRAPPKVYRLAAGDVLGVYIAGVLGERDQPIPVHFPQDGSPPSTGYPIVVRDDGTIDLPQIPPLQVAGMSMLEAEDAIRRSYIDEHHILAQRDAHLLVSLMRERTVPVLVVREDTARSASADPNEALHRGAVTDVELKASESDALHALAASGGLPGQDAKNEVQILHGDAPRRDPTLRRGDVLKIESRDAEVYYTAGLLDSGEHLLPRDRPLDVLAAIAKCGGPGNIQPGTLPPTRAIIYRRTPDGGQATILVDLERAKIDLSQRVQILPGDMLVVDHTPAAKVANFGVSQINNGLLLRWLLQSR